MCNLPCNQITAKKGYRRCEQSVTFYGFWLVTKSHPLCVLDIRILLLTKRTIRIRSSSCNVSQGALFDLRGGIGTVTRFFLRVTSGKRRTSANVSPPGAADVISSQYYTLWCLCFWSLSPPPCIFGRDACHYCIAHWFLIATLTTEQSNFPFLSHNFFLLLLNSYILIFSPPWKTHGEHQSC